ncbi:MAG TPA: GTPase Era [Terriglobia bacterium]|nr:GTPase Era [Terriglobia bacterium]
MPEITPFKCGFVAIVGRPNAGKSTLVNTLVAEKVSIVTPAPQTTRNRILGVVNRPGAQIILVDTPGVQRPLYRLNQQMMEFVRQSLEARDLVVLMVDASTSFGKGDEFVVELLKQYRVRALLALNKIDIIRKARLLPLMDRYAKLYDFEEIFPISGLKGSGLEDLTEALIRRLPESEPLFPPDYYTDQPERFLAAELIREKVILHTQKELPYVTAVLIEGFEESERLTRIRASIVVEKESQKPIVIGAEGAKIKQIGIEARRDLERIFPPQVFLDLHVRVEPQWRDDPATVAALDYRMGAATS